MKSSNGSNNIPEIIQTSRGPVEYLDSGTGPVIVALHGAMGGYDQSDILARTVGPTGYRFIAVSRPGYLGTPLSVGASPADQADACAELLNVLRIPEACVMAISGGGPCAIHFALRHASRCRALVLLSTCGMPTKSRIPFSFRIMEFLARYPRVIRWMQKKAEGNLEKNLSRSIADPVVLARTLADPVARPLVEELTIGMFNRMNERVQGTDNDIRVSQTTAYPLEKVSVPTLVVHGTADKLVPYEQHGKVLGTRIPGAELLAVDGGEHVTIFTHRDLVRERVADFLTRVPGCRQPPITD
jgi:pimeloyl-ACP methyl ester carboxylesterase